MKGTVRERIGFLPNVLQDMPGNGLRRIQPEWDSLCGVQEDERIAEETGYRQYFYSHGKASHYRRY